MQTNQAALRGEALVEFAVGVLDDIGFANTVDLTERDHVGLNRLMQLPNGDWRGAGRCFDQENEASFESTGKTFSYDNARAICAGCVVRAQCLLDTVTTELKPSSMHAGLTPQQIGLLRAEIHLPSPRRKPTAAQALIAINIAAEASSKNSPIL